MKIQKIKNFGKKFFASIMLAIFTLSIFTPTTQAVQLFGDDVTYDTSFMLPDVVENGGKILYSFKQDSDIPFSSLACFDGHDEMGSCTRYAVTVTPSFFFNVKNPNLDGWNNHVTYILGNLSLSFYIDSELTEAEGSEYVYFKYNAKQLHNVENNTEGNIAKVPKTQCGSKNPDYCFVVFHVYMYMTGGEGGVLHLSSIDMIKYSDENDNMLFYKRDTEKRDPRDFLYQLSVWMGGNSAYGKKLGYIGNERILASGYNDQKEEIYLVTDDNKFSWKRMIDGQEFPYIRFFSPITTGKTSYSLVINSYEQLKNYDASTTHIRDFLVGSNKNLQGNLPDYFGAKGIDAGVVNNNTGEVEKDPNVYNDPNFNKKVIKCDGLDIPCYIASGIKVFIDSIGEILGGFFKGIFDFLKLIWNIISGLFNGFIDLSNYVIGSLSGNPPTSDEDNFINDLLKGAIIKWDLVFGTNEQLVCDAKFNYSFTDSEKNYIAEEYRKFVPDDAFIYTIFGLFNFMDPIPPSNGEMICTYSGMKQINYRDNSWLDIVLVIMFCGMILGLFYRNYN